MVQKVQRPSCMSKNLPLSWAQDKLRVFITIKLAGVQNEEIKFESNGFNFKGHVEGDADYDTFFEVFEEICPVDRDTKYQRSGRYFQVILRKRDSRIWWPRLAKTSQKLHNVSIDWDKWIEDEDADADAKDGSDCIELPNCADADFTSSDDSDHDEGKTK
jgi:hypothetical protein